MRPINQPGNHHGVACIFLQTRGGEKKCVAIIFCSPQRDEVEEADFRRSRKSKRGKIAATLEQCVTSTFVIYRYDRSWNESRSIFEGGKKILEKLSIVLISGKLGN